jgi:Icc-related predicted phosphoesterase
VRSTEDRANDDTVRFAAVGDLHVGDDGPGPRFDDVADEADVLLLAGDLTRRGRPSEAARLAALLEGLPLPVLAVLGNHDHHVGAADEVVAVLETAGVQVLDGTSVELDVRGLRVGVAGVKGFGGGMAGRCATAFGEPEMQQFVAAGALEVERLRTALASLRSDVRIVLLHYAPVEDTLRGEPPEIHPFLGDYRLAEAIDELGADLVLHGHAHLGREHGRTAGGVPVRNVARPVIRECYRVYELRASDDPASAGDRSRAAGVPADSTISRIAARGTARPGAGRAGAPRW